MGSRKKKKKGRPKKASWRPERRALPGRLPAGTRFITTPAGMRKMSEVLWEFIDPYLHHCQQEDALRKLITVALIAWNATLMPEPKREAFLRDMAKTVPPEAQADMLSIVAEMMQRKEQFFAEDRRPIIDYELTMGPEGPHLVVASALPGP